MFKRFQRLCGFATIALFGLTAAPVQADTVTLHIFDFDFGNAAQEHFDPTIKVGDTIEWVWDANTELHSTTSVAGISESWDSGLFLSRTPFDHTFTHAGDFSYYCSLHGFDLGNQTADGMAGIIHVAAVPEPGLLAALPMLLGLGAISLRHRRKSIALPR